jgi:hypothetical protein
MMGGRLLSDFTLNAHEEAASTSGSFLSVVPEVGSRRFTDPKNLLLQCVAAEAATRCAVFHVLVPSRTGDQSTEILVMSDRDFMILGKLVLTFGCLLGWPIWELWKLKRDRSATAHDSGEEERGRITGEHE